MTFKRARSDEQRKTRIEEIITATADIYDKKGYDELSFSAISQITKFTRPTIYKYFSTKEEILLRILANDLHVWIHQLISCFEPNVTYSIKEITQIWTKSISDNKRMMELYSILYTMLEKNAKLETLVNFKKDLFEGYLLLFDLLKKLFPKTQEDQIRYFLVMQSSLALGLYPMCNMTAPQIEAVKLSKAPYEMPDFMDYYARSVYHLMYCMENNIGM